MAGKRRLQCNHETHSPHFNPALVRTQYKTTLVNLADLAFLGAYKNVLLPLCLLFLIFLLCFFKEGANITMSSDGLVPKEIGHHISLEVHS